jgi:hypothetical protein
VKTSTMYGASVIRCSEQTELICRLFVIVADEFNLSAIFGRFLDQVASQVVFTAPPNFAAIKFAVSHGNTKLLSPGRILQIGEQPITTGRRTARRY